jgi:type IV secretion system protein VirB9
MKDARSFGKLTTPLRSYSRTRRGSCQAPTSTTTDTARVVKYGQYDIVPLKAKLRSSTLIMLPEKEEILDFTTGDKEFWITNSAHNLCSIHPPTGRNFAAI